MASSRATASRRSSKDFTTPLRRSNRLNPRPVTTYADPPEVISGNGSNSPLILTKRWNKTDVKESSPKLRHQSRPSNDLTQKFSQKRCRTKGEKTPDPEELDEELLRRTCESLNINYSLFDDWTEDPRGIKIEDMKIPFLPSEIMLQIFSECRPEVLVECKKTCRRFRDLLSGNSSIWRKARDKSYPGLPLKLPLDFDEEELFDMTTGKKCDYCDTKKKVRPYYVWSVRCCQECIKTLTLSASEFKRMLKRKVGESSDWDAQKRELICHTIKWHDLPTGARLCWKEEAYARINEAEEVLLEERFREWYLESSVSKDMREVFWVLEDWGADVPRMMKKDKENEKNKVIDTRKELYKAWCLKVLPNPIPSETLPLLSAYNSTVNKPGFLTKKEFVLSLPRLIRDSVRFDDEVRRHKALERQNRLKHDDLLEETVQQVMHALIREGSAKDWGGIVREKVKEASSSKIELRFPKDTPEAVLREWRWRCNDLGIPLLYRFANLLEEALDRETSPYRDLLHPSVFEFFENEEDRIFTCHGLSMQFTHIGPTFHRCKYKEHMTLLELAQHFVEMGIRQQDLTHLIVGKWEYMIKFAPSVTFYSSCRHTLGRRERQRKITQFLQRS